MIVVDASVAAKCYVAEEDSDKAIRLVSGLEKLIAPELIRVEVAAAICRRVRLGEIQPEEALVRCKLWRQHLEEKVISMVNNAELMAEAEKLSTDLKHPVQDCLYLALARQRQADLVTADGVFEKKAAHSYERFYMIADYAEF